MKGKPNLLFLRGICVCQEGFLEALFGGLDVWPVRHRPRFTLALLYPALPTHTDTAGGRVSEQKESKAEGQGKKKSAFQGLMCGNQMRGLAQIRSPGNQSDMLREYH